MRIFVADSETTGLDPEKDLLLELGIVLYDSSIHGTDVNKVDFSSLPKLALRIIHELGDVIYSDVVESMNERLLTPLRTREYLKPRTNLDYEYVNPTEIQGRIMKFLLDNQFITQEEFDNNKLSTNKLNVLGKNFAMFDRKFLEKVVDFNKLRHRQRILDPGIIYARIDDTELPNLKTCMERSGIFDETHQVAHTAVEDCIDTLKLVINKLGFSSEPIV